MFLKRYSFYFAKNLFSYPLCFGRGHLPCTTDKMGKDSNILITGRLKMMVCQNKQARNEFRRRFDSNVNNPFEIVCSTAFHGQALHARALEQLSPKLFLR